MASLAAILPLRNPIQDDITDAEYSHGLLLEEDHSMDAYRDSPSVNNDDFLLEDEEEEHAEHRFDDSSTRNQQSNNNAAWVQLLNLPPANHSRHGVTPVGGLRRVSSCYFSIASNLSAGDGHSAVNAADNASFYSPNVSTRYAYDALSFEGRKASDFLLHDVLMSVFSFLDARALASFSETARRPNFECFYFLELQLQRALLMGEGHDCFGGPDAGGGALGDIDEDQAMGHDEGGNIVAWEGGWDGPAGGRVEGDDADDGRPESDKTALKKSNPIPSFEGSIAGTGVISRLASLDPALARRIVQTYLDSNSSIQSMPLSHSLAYFRQVLLRQSQQCFPPIPHPPNFPDSVAKNARNMALFFTLLGAAYMRSQQGVGEMPMPTIPDPSEVLNEETMEALKGMMLKVGLAGGFLKAGKTMKERVEAEQQQQQANAAVAAGRDRARRANQEPEVLGVADVSNVDVDDIENENGRMGNVLQPPTIPDGVAKNARNMALFITLLGAAYMRSQQSGGEIPIPTMPDPSEVLNEENMEALKGMVLKVGLAGGFLKAGKTVKERVEAEQQQQWGLGRNEHSAEHENGAADVARSRRSSQQRSSSLGGLEDLSNMVPHPSAIASRLYNAFSNSNNSSADDRSHPIISTATNSAGLPLDDQENILPGRRRHRGKRSHKTLRHELNDISGSSSEEEQKSSKPEAATNEEQKMQEEPSISPEEIAYAMDHPFSPNPYDHPFSSTLNAASAAAGAGGEKNPSNKDTVVSEATPFFSFNMESHDSSAMSKGNKPTGCIGAYARAVKFAASEVMRLVKAERKADFDALPPNEQHELGVRFIDACASDTKLHMVKDMLRGWRGMDVDRFFVGPDDTETCALHAAAFNGAGRVLEFLCSGIDERDPAGDGGLCDVDVRDANGWTALHFAAGANSVESVRALSGHGAELTIEASNGYTPFHWAERLSNEEAATELERLGADNRFVGRWTFGRRGGGDDREISPISFFANRFFALSNR